MVKEPSKSEVLEELHREGEELRHEEELRRDEKRVTFAIAVISVFILILLFGVSYLVIKSEKSKESNAVSNTAPEAPSEEKTYSPSPSQSPTPTPQVRQKTNTKSETKEYYVNIGSGTNQSLDWTDVAGALATFDITSYENIKSVYFEAFINVPTANGKVSVRLFNKTDNHVVWNSEVTRDATMESYQFISPKLSYDSGPKLYQVQMKSQLGVLSNLVSARIRIIAE